MDEATRYGTASEDTPSLDARRTGSYERAAAEAARLARISARLRARSVDVASHRSLDDAPVAQEWHLTDWQLANVVFDPDSLTRDAEALAEYVAGKGSRMARLFADILTLVLTWLNKFVSPQNSDEKAMTVGAQRHSESVLLAPKRLCAPAHLLPTLYPSARLNLLPSAQVRDNSMGHVDVQVSFTDIIIGAVARRRDWVTAA